MNLRLTKITLSLLAMLPLLTGCGNDEKFDETPYLEWRGYEYDSTGVRSITLITYFTDGDGDIGDRPTSPSDSCTDEPYDLFIHYFEKVGGSYKEVFPPDSCLPFHIPFPEDLTPEGQNKTLEGEIFTPFSYRAFPQNPNVDSIKFEMQLRDRSGKRSEVVYSPAIPAPE